MSPPGTDATVPSPAPSHRTFGWPRALPPVRLVWISLAILGAYGSYYLQGLGTVSLIELPLVALVVDLGLQGIRFERWRFPDAAIVTGLFLALILPPTAPPVLTGAVAFAAVAIRHALRSHGHPWLNPAALGVTLGAVLLGLAPAWWVGIGPWGETAVVALGLLLIARTPSSWRLPALFLLTYGFLSVLQHLILGATTDPRVLLLQAIDPATLFFALFMVSEPRTAPGASHQKVLYAGVIGSLAAFLPIFLPSLGVLVSLLAGNLLAVLLRAHPSERARSTADRRTRSLARDPAPRRRGTPSRWPIAYRVGTGVAVVIVLAAVVGAVPVAPSGAPILRVSNPGGVPTSGGGSVAAACQTDNPSIPASELSALHKVLGPSVILSYNSGTGVVVFYDPVNQVTVTESDLYEDYGFAEFNGDDYAVSGCAA